ncbi:PREDICTED: putative uncharacterized protein C16orf47 homolog [Apaloderma vittatum]|uniref:putative uncharacterized protein C16orf47 homolog n=1 Tax=Apaloderma vittatum TaxID=57397 RepID=UPI00052123F4|nr:PREDICTED: putative uncharacterized protein C16orf47 homolog [Apaloderma vittatum]
MELYSITELIKDLCELVLMVAGAKKGLVGLPRPPSRHDRLLSQPSMPRSLDVSVPEQRCSSCYLGRLWPPKYLVSSHSVKWN